ncbi:MAG: clostripain-related cysteine peptidase [candidate division WOR-3 bacterium]|nr:clostripain-related cysteine peptidase [candidate division WOR-3 bacterium]
MRALLIAVFLFVLELSASPEWTVMIYMCADNSMSLQALDDISEITQVPSTDNVKIILQVDNQASSSNPNTARYLVGPSGLELLLSLGEVDMADPQTLIEFVRFSSQVYRAKNYLLVLWDHGNGWPIGNYGSYKDKAVIYDESSNNWLGVADGELKYALSEIKQILKRKLSILIFDACLMAMAEVMTELINNVEYVIAAENRMPWDGLPYEEVLSWLTSNPQTSLQNLACQIVNLTYNFYLQNNTSCAFSAIDIDKFNEAFLNFKTNSYILRKYAQNLKTAAIRNIVQTLAIENDPPQLQDDYIDLLDFLIKCQSVISYPKDQKEVNKITDKFRNAVILNRTTSHNLQNAYGISLWFPDNYLAFKYQVNEYKNLVWAKNTLWLNFLNDYFGVDDVKPTPVNLKLLRPVSNNNLELIWTHAFDLSKVNYTLIRAHNTNLVFSDQAYDLTNWDVSGFVISNRQAYSLPSAFYSDEGSLLVNYLQTKNSFALPYGGILEFYSYYVTEETYINNHLKCDIFYVEYSHDKQNFYVLDSFYGIKPYWSKHRYLLPKSESLYLRFRYKTDQTTNRIGVYLDDIKIFKFQNAELVNENYPDSLFYLYNQRKGQYDYYILPQDSFGNIGYLSEALTVNITEYATPYSVPSPFSTDCKIILDFPPQLQPKLYIYTLTGELVKEINYQSFNKDTAYWDGKNLNHQEVASGLYLVLLKAPNFKKIGKIAKISKSRP